MFTDNNLKEASKSITFFSIVQSQGLDDLKFRRGPKSKLKLQNLTEDLDQVKQNLHSNEQ